MGIGSGRWAWEGVVVLTGWGWMGNQSAYDGGQLRACDARRLRGRRQEGRKIVGLSVLHHRRIARCRDHRDQSGRSCVLRASCTVCFCFCVCLCVCLCACLCACVPHSGVRTRKYYMYVAELTMYVGGLSIYLSAPPPPSSISLTPTAHG